MKYILIIITAIIAISCENNNEKSVVKEKIDFKPESLLTNNYKTKTIRGQLLYLPVYSNLPYSRDAAGFDMKAYVAIHNTDLLRKIKITKVIYFNQEGKAVFDFLKDDSYTLNPLTTKDFHIPYEDKSGLGANFLVEWISDEKVSEPLIECVTMSLKSNQSLAITSNGKVIREMP
jgi:hypothetical protein